MRWLFILLGIGLIAYLCTGIRQVGADERAVVFRFGKVVATPGPGLWVGLPWGIDRVERVAVDQVRRVTVGYRPEADDATGTPPGQLLTGDHNLVNVQVVIDYQVRPDQLEDYVVQSSRVDGLVSRAAEAALADWVAGHGIDEVLLTRKASLPIWLVQQTQERIDPYRLGVQIQSASIAYLLPPEDVRPSFDEVTRAETAIRTAEHKAREDADRRRRESDAERYSLEQSTAAYVNEKMGLARAEAEAFTKRQQQYEKLKLRNPDVLASIWYDEMGKVFERVNRTGRIDLLDNYLGPDGLDITIFAPKRK